MDFSKKILWQCQNAYIKAVGLKNKIYNKYTPDDFIWINGSGRSGTTWLGELMSTIPNSKLTDEPCKRNDSKRLLKINLRGIQYIPQGSTDWKEINSFFDDFFKTTEFNPNYFHQDISNLNNIKYWIVKEIRSHLFLPWLIDRYQLNKVINIVRNPYDVINSQRQHGAWDKNMTSFDFSSFHYKDYYTQYERLYKPINSNIEYLAFEWCLQNSYLLNHEYNNQKWLTIRYEALKANPVKTIEQIFSFINIDVPPNIMENISKPSISSINNKDKKSKSQLETKDIETINYFLNAFQMNEFIS
jgi:hypothetical protein